MMSNKLIVVQKLDDVKPTLAKLLSEGYVINNSTGKARKGQQTVYIMTLTQAEDFHRLADLDLSEVEITERAVGKLSKAAFEFLLSRERTAK